MSRKNSALQWNQWIAIPNLITLSRIGLVIAFIVVTSLAGPEGVKNLDLRWAGAILFIIAATTDKIDGYLARKLSQVTELGALLDPIADKVLISAALIILSAFGGIWWWVTALFLIREFGITLYRFFIISRRNIVIPANMNGKLKTVFESLSLALLLIPAWSWATESTINIWLWYYRIAYILLGVSLGLCLYSGIYYVVVSIRLLRKKDTEATKDTDDNDNKGTHDIKDTKDTDNTKNIGDVKDIKDTKVQVTKEPDSTVDIHVSSVGNKDDKNEESAQIANDAIDDNKTEYQEIKHQESDYRIEKPYEKDARNSHLVLLTEHGNASLRDNSDDNNMASHYFGSIPAEKISASTLESELSSAMKNSDREEEDLASLESMSRVSRRSRKRTSSVSTSKLSSSDTLVSDSTARFSNLDSNKNISIKTSTKISAKDSIKPLTKTSSSIRDPKAGKNLNIENTPVELGIPDELFTFPLDSTAQHLFDQELLDTPKKKKSTQTKKATKATRITQTTDVPENRNHSINEDPKSKSSINHSSQFYL